MGVKSLYFDGGILEINELRHLCKIFPNVESLRIDAENILEYKTDLTGLKNLTRLAISVSASNEFAGEVDEENTDPNF